MLTLHIQKTKLFNEKDDTFIHVKEQTLQMEHSLISLAKWESKWNKPFLSKQEKTFEETIDYIKCMTLTQNVDPNVYKCLTNAQVQQINDYISAPMTATTISDEAGSSKASREIITAEVIYYWMIALNIPDRFEKWHLNRLLMLIRVCNAKNTPPKKRSQRDIANSYKAINEANRKRFKSKG